MKLSLYNRNKINILNLILIVLVVYIHSFFIEASEFKCAMAVQKFSGTSGVARLAVPMFFCISGFLFFNGITNIKECFPKMLKRVRTLVVPYILWNSIVAILYLLLAYIPIICVSGDNHILAQFNESFLLGLKYVFWRPVAFHLWFLRDLIILVACSPLIYVACKHLKWITPILFIITSVWCNLNPLVFFSFGGCVALYCNIETVRVNHVITLFSLLIFIINAFVQIWHSDIHPYFSTIIDFCGIIGIWGGYDLIMKNRVEVKSWIRHCIGYSFFIYLFHEPFINIIKKLGLYMIGIHEWSLVLLYIITPIIMVVISISVAKIMQKYTPKTYSILTGGR